MQITLPENVAEAIQTEAAQCGVTGNILTRIRLCMLFSKKGIGEKKSYLVTLENWQKIEDYAKARGFEIDLLLSKATEYYIKKYHLSAVQKTEIEGNIEKQEKTLADASAEL